MTWLDGKLSSSNDPATPTTPTRAIGTSFQPSLTGWTMVHYTIQLSAATTQDGTVTMSTGAADPPATAKGSARHSNANAATHVVRQQLSAIVPPGHFVKLVATGNTTNTIIEQSECVIS